LGGTFKKCTLNVPAHVPGNVPAMFRLKPA